jgi:hypothetical protein
MRKIFVIAISILVAIGCKKIEEGFLSDQIRYKDNLIYCKRGLILVQSDKIEADGSTPPYTFKMVNFRDKATGASAPAEFNTDYEVLVFKDGMSFNIETDTTVVLLNQKREIKKLKPMYFNEKSGQLTFNKASGNLPLGEYTFDLEMNNVRGTKTFPSIAQVNVLDPSGEDLFTIEDNVANAFSDATGAVTAMRNPKLTCTKQSSDGARVILKFSDKNGVPFNPKAGEIIKRGDRPIFENYSKFNPVIITDTAMICDFEVAPFPLSRYITPTTDWNHLMYYRIPSTYADVDGFAAAKYSVNPRFAFVLKLEGTYIIEIKFPDVVHR